MAYARRRQVSRTRSRSTGAGYRPRAVSRRTSRGRTGGARAASQTLRIVVQPAAAAAAVTPVSMAQALLSPAVPKKARF